MKTTGFRITLLAACAGFAVAQEPVRSPATSYADTVRQLGVIKNTSEAAPGYTLFAPKHYTSIYLMANDGQIVNEWKSQYEPGQSVYLLPNGHLLHCCLTKNKSFIGGGEGGRLEEFDWEGNLVWEYVLSDDKNLMHHDIAPLPNGNILAMVVELKTMEEAVKAGFNPDAVNDSKLFPDYIVEIQKTGPKSGKIVWEWHVWDHLIQSFDKSKDNYGDVAANPGKIDPNGSGRRAKAFWNHFNSIDYNAKLDQIVISVRGNSEFWIINHGITTEEAKGPKGDLLYRWGNPSTYQHKAKQTLFQQHDSQWIAEGCPGAGNILVFNNGLGRGYTSVDELMTPLKADGTYEQKSDGTYGPDKLVWSYTDPDPKTFFSQEISSAQRLSNGNTLICAGVHGTLFEVTSAGQTVWEYVNPVTTRVLKQGETVPLDHRYHAQNAIFKAQRYAPDYPAFKGRELKPRGLLVENLENPVSPERRADQEHANMKPNEGGGGGKERGKGGGEKRSDRPPRDEGNDNN